MIRWFPIHRLKVAAEYIKGMWRPRNTEFARRKIELQVCARDLRARSGNQLIQLKDWQQHREHDEQNESTHQDDHQRPQ